MCATLKPWTSGKILHTCLGHGGSKLKEMRKGLDICQPRHQLSVFNPHCQFTCFCQICSTGIEYCQMCLLSIVFNQVYQKLQFVLCLLESSYSLNASDYIFYMCFTGLLFLLSLLILIFIYHSCRFSCVQVIKVVLLETYINFILHLCALV